MEKENSKKKPATIRHLDLPPKPGNGKSLTSSSSPDPFHTTYEKNEIPVLDSPPLPPDLPLPLSPGSPLPLSPDSPPPLPPGLPLPLSPGSPLPLSPGSPLPLSPGSQLPLSPGSPPPLSPGSPLPLSPGSPPPQLLVLEQHEVLPIPEGRDNSGQPVLQLAIDYCERLEPACDLSPPSSPNHLEFHLEEWLYLYMHPVDLTEPMFVSGYESISAYHNNTKFITNTQ